MHVPPTGSRRHTHASPTAWECTCIQIISGSVACATWENQPIYTYKDNTGGKGWWMGVFTCSLVGCGDGEIRRWGQRWRWDPLSGPTGLGLGKAAASTANDGAEEKGDADGWTGPAVGRHQRRAWSGGGSRALGMGEAETALGVGGVRDGSREGRKEKPCGAHAWGPRLVGRIYDNTHDINRGARAVLQTLTTEK